MKLTNRQKYDRRDVDREELALVLEGHRLWREYKKSLKSQPLEQRQALYARLELVWEQKRELRAILAKKREAEAENVAARFRKHHADLLDHVAGQLEAELDRDQNHD